MTIPIYPNNGVDWMLVQRTLRNWVLWLTQFSDDKVVWAQQDKLPRPVAPAIILRISNIAETDHTWVDQENNPLTFADKTISAVDPSTDTFTCAAHGLNNGDGPVQFATTGVMPGGLAAATDYWIIFVDANHFKVADTFVNTGGAMPQGTGNPVTVHDVTTAGTGTLKMSATPDTVPAGAEILAVARGYLRVTLEMHAYSATGVGVDMATSVLQRVKSRRMLPTPQAILQAANIGLLECDRVRAVTGIKDALLFEPRSYLDCHFCVVSEEAEAQTIIETVEITDGFSNIATDVTTD